MSSIFLAPHAAPKDLDGQQGLSTIYGGNLVPANRAERNNCQNLHFIPQIAGIDACRHPQNPDKLLLLTGDYDLLTLPVNRGNHAFSGKLPRIPL